VYSYIRVLFSGVLSMYELHRDMKTGVLVQLKNIVRFTKYIIIVQKVRVQITSVGWSYIFFETSCRQKPFYCSTRAVIIDNVRYLRDMHCTTWSAVARGTGGHGASTTPGTFIYVEINLPITTETVRGL